jgi:hypothetical protein
MTTETRQTLRDVDSTLVLPTPVWSADESPEPDTERGPVERVLDGAAVLDEARAFVARFAVLPSPAALDAAVLRAAHTRAVDAFNASPRLAVLSDLPASGKTRMLELVGLLSHDPGQEVDITGPALVAMIAQRRPTVLLDESTRCSARTAGTPTVRCGAS